jgi:hypothetical protein
MLNRSGESGHPCLIPDFKGNGFSFSPLTMMLAVGLSYIAQGYNSVSQKQTQKGKKNANRNITIL